MSNHHATLLRGTVEAFLPFYDVYITDWADSRTLPLSAGRFDLDDYIDYVIAICETLSKKHDGLSLHTLGVCQPSVPLIAAVALMEAQDSPHVPASMTLMGGPIDRRLSWRAIFFINVPIALLTLGLAIWRVPESRDAPDDGTVDWRGAFLATLGLAGLAYSLTAASDFGWM